MAAKMRVLLCEDGGGLRVEERAEELKALMEDTDFMGRRIHWQRWYDNSFLLQLDRTRAHLQTLGLPPCTILREVSGGAPRPWTREVETRAKRTTQRFAYQALLRQAGATSGRRMEDKIDRWHLPGHQPTVADRIISNMRALRPLVPPRVQAAVFSTLWNRWATARRFQVRGTPCLLGCSHPQGEDSIDHYMECPVALHAAAGKLRLHLGAQTARRCLMLADVPNHVTDERSLQSWLTRCAILVYAVYRTTNTARHRGMMDYRVATQALKEAMYEGTRGHSRAMRCVDTVYAH